MNAELLTYSRSKGIFAGLTLEGAVVEQDADSTTAIYGRDVSFRHILTGRVASPSAAASFLDAVADVDQRAKAHEEKEHAQNNQR